ncbi:hypothetical protein BMS3Abin15_00542 [bacterium BMS3Abin15]|nr:hypothetical protein BMS3Abin15_00542 [bacterium BMS3Abin15]HDL01140.1 hypothetical protein [candidate division Zixibacteria bacterium]HDZ86023.1 hypothetical protein [Candidatus Moranbacteria bacterium]
MKNQILKAIQEALAGSRKLKITFKDGTVSYLAYLRGMQRGGIIGISDDDNLIIDAIMDSKKWGRDENRTLTVTLKDSFDSAWFTGRMERALERIEAVK